MLFSHNDSMGGLWGILPEAIGLVKSPVDLPTRLKRCAGHYRPDVYLLESEDSNTSNSNDTLAEWRSVGVNCEAVA